MKKGAVKMKKILIALSVLLLVPVFVNAAKTAKEEKKPAVVVITRAGQVIEELEKRGITGKEGESGVLQDVFKVLSLREYKSIVGDADFTVAVWDYSSTLGFDIAVKLFQALTLVTDKQVYKSRPYIISLSGDKANVGKIVLKLKEILPSLREIGEKEY
jgi:hypothetical protein